MLLLTHRCQESLGNHGKIKNDTWEWAKTHPNERLLIEDTKK